MIVRWLSTFKVGLSQVLLLLGASVVGVLAALLKYKTHQLHETRVKLLESHLKAQDDLWDQKRVESAKRVNAAREKYEEARRRLSDSDSGK